MTIKQAYAKIEKWFGSNHPLQSQMLAMLLDSDNYLDEEDYSLSDEDIEDRMVYAEKCGYCGDYIGLCDCGADNDVDDARGYDPNLKEYF